MLSAVHGQFRRTVRSNGAANGASSGISVGGWLAIAAIVVASYVGGLGVMSEMTLWLTSALLALSLQFIWGYGGMLSFCQNAFYGIGAYTFGVAAVNLFSPGTTALYLIASGIGAACVAAALGYFMFYGRVGELAVAITTYAFTLVIYTISTGVQFTAGKATIGGANGLTGIPSIGLGFGMAPPLGVVGLFVATLLIVVLFWWFLGVMRASWKGRVLDALRQNESRCELLGYDVRLYRLGAFVLSGAVAGIAGGLFASWSQFVAPGQFSAQNAALVVVWVLVGGRRSPAGAVVGAILIQAAQYYLGQGTLSSQATLVLGLIAIVVVLVLPDGLASLVSRLKVRREGVVPMGADNAASSDSSRAPSGELAGQNSHKLPAILGPEHGAAEGAGRGRSEGLNGASASESTGEPLLRVVDASRAFGGVRAVAGMNLEVRKGQIHCVIGPNGAGKSTFFNLLVGRLSLDTGQVFLEGRDVSRLPTYARAKLGIGVKLQTASFFPELSVQENVWLAAKPHAAAKDVDEEVVHCVRDVGLEDSIDLLASSLSHGQQQWLEIAMVLAQKPKLLLLDEPVAGMTVGERDATVRMIMELVNRCGVVVVEHDMTVVERLGGEVTVMHEGRLLRSGSIAEVRADDEVLDAYLGRGAEL